MSLENQEPSIKPDLGVPGAGRTDTCETQNPRPPRSLPVMSRVWAMPSAETFDVPPIAGFVRKYLMRSRVSVDPFARNRRWATYTNDINPNTAATSHQDAEQFLKELLAEGVEADLLIFDPPYSPRQLKECYASFGRKMQLEDGQTARLRSLWRDAAAPLLAPGAVVLSFGWNTVGMGRKYGFEIIEILIVCHGAEHNDTLCMAERRVAEQPWLNFEDANSVPNGNAVLPPLITPNPNTL